MGLHELAQEIEQAGEYVRSQGSSSIPPTLFDVEPCRLSKKDAGVLYATVRGLGLSREWEDALKSLVAVNDPRTAQPLDSMAEAIKHLVKIAFRERLWVARVLSRVCTALTARSCEDPDRKYCDKAAAAIRQAFRVVVTEYENEEPQEGRTLECYSIAVLLLRLYVRMHAYSLAEGIMNAINAYSGNIAPLNKSDPKVQVQFLFYRGMLAFFDQKYSLCCECLSIEQGLTAVQLEHVMVYLIPSKYLAENRTPTPQLWQALPRLDRLYRPLIDSTRRGDYAGFVEHLKKNADTLRANRLYLACDLLIPRLRLNLLRRCWELLDRPKRVPISIYAAALSVAGFKPLGVTTAEAAEFYISQFILKGEVKGYIHHELQLLLISQTQPFPTLVRRQPQ